MFDIENAVREWKRELRKLEPFEEGTISELESHLLDEFDRRKRLGLSDEAAFEKAAAAVGLPKALGAEFFKDGARSRLAVPSWAASRFSPALVWNTLKIALRKMRRQKGTSFINIAGLAVGMTACLLILFWVRDELGFERFNRNADDIHRLVIEDRYVNRTVFITEMPFPLAEALKAEIPEVEAVARTSWARFQVRHGDRAFNENAVVFVDPAFFDVFSFTPLAGKPAAGLEDTLSIVLNEKAVARYFGDEDPLGKTLNLDGRNDYTVSAVVRIPRNSDFQYDFFLPMRSLVQWGMDLAALESNWKGRMYRTYLRLRAGTDSRALERKISGFLERWNPERDERLRLQPLTRMHLFGPDGTPAGMRFVVAISAVAVLILLIACVNFMNLSTARSGARAREIGLRKMVGARRSQLVRQILAESLLMSLLSLLLSLLLMALALPFFNRLTGKQLSLNVFDPSVALGLVSTALLAGMLAGGYPALVLSAFKPAAVLKGRFASQRRGLRLRKGLIVFQFSISILLVIAATVIMAQLKFIQSREIGFDRENLVYAYMMGRNRDNAENMKRELAKHPGFLGAATCNNLPTQILYQAGIDWEGRSPDKEVQWSYTIGDFAYIDTFRMTIVRGRNFSRERGADEDNFLINEEAARQMGLDSPLGVKLKFMGQRWGEIIGVVKDFNFRGMGLPIRPLVVTPKGRKSYLVARLKPGEPAPAIRYFREAWNRVNAGFVFEYGFVDQDFDGLYQDERRLGLIISCFSFLAILVSCLGLFGLTSYTAEQKTKEIGVRKVLGASAAEISRKLASEFLRWVLLANLIAWPAAYWIMSAWLRNYAYRTRLAVWMFVLSAALSLLIAMATVSYQSLKAALANPVESLRYE